MIESYIRPGYQKWLVDPLANIICQRTRWSPAVITLMAILSGVLCSLLLLLGMPVTAIMLLLVSGYLDSLDGTVARMQVANSAKGAVLDIVADRIVEFAIMLGLYSVAPAARALPVIIMLGATLICITSFLVVGVFVENSGHKSFHYSVGIMERAEAFAFFTAMILLPHWFSILAWLYSILVIATAGIRVYQFMKYDYA